MIVISRGAFLRQKGVPLLIGASIPLLVGFLFRLQGPTSTSRCDAAPLFSEGQLAFIDLTSQSTAGAISVRNKLKIKGSARYDVLF